MPSPKHYPHGRPVRYSLNITHPLLAACATRLIEDGGTAPNVTQIIHRTMIAYTQDKHLLTDAEAYELLVNLNILTPTRGFSVPMEDTQDGSR